MAAMECTSVKTCTKCDETKELDQFSVAIGRLGRSARCKPCQRSRQMEYLSRDGVADRYKKINKKRYLDNKPAILAQQLVRYHARKDEPAMLAASRIRTGIRSALTGARKSVPTFSLLGYSKDDLAKHIECQFLTGMSWDNAHKWHIDHIVPLSAFLSRYGNTEEAVRRAWSLPNLRPLWAVANMQKHAKRTHLI